MRSPYVLCSHVKAMVSAALKVCIVESGAKMAVSFHVLSTGVCLCRHGSHPRPAKTKLKPRLVGLQRL